MEHILQHLIEKCIARHKQNRHPYRMRVYQNEYAIYYASRDGKLQSASPNDFADANLGIIPIAKNGYPIEQYAASVGKDWQTRYGFDDWESRSWKQSYGVQVYTGIPSEDLTDLDFEFDIVRDHPDILLETLDALFSLTKNPCLTISKSGGIRFSCRSPDYVHPRSTEEREYIAKYNQETGTREALYLEIFGDKGLSRWDARYEIITGNLFDLPVIKDVDALFEIIDNLKSKIHVPAPPKQKKQQQKQKNKKKMSVAPVHVNLIDGLPSDIVWIPTGENGKYKSKRGNYQCRFTKHTKSHGAVQYYKDNRTDAISEFCHNCREWQQIQSPKQTKTLPLKITGEINQTYVTLSENEQAIQNAFADVMAAPQSDKPHYLILTFEMGTGKNEAFLTSLATSQKKGLLITENHLQVDQNVNRGTAHGLRGKGFRGRSYHFNDTPLSMMPIKLRQQSPEFFEKYDVVCLFYDHIVKRNKKGLAATPYCQVCPLKNECPYLHQFSGLSQIDLLVISAQDLFFDPGFWNLLRRLTTVETETIEEEIIGAAFGLDPETKTSFDLGVVDETKAIKLYQGYSYQIHAFDKLAHAWEGELYGDFMSSLIEALGTENPYTEVQTLLTQLDSDTEKHISQQMTQVPIPVDVHPHILRNKDNDEMLSEYYAKPVGAAEDDYDNEWRIPISSQAEDILRQKNVLTLPYQSRQPTKIGTSPYPELKKGTLRLSDIAGQVWSPDWTLLHQLKNAIKIDIEKIGIRYTPRGEAINCDTLTITVPPQVNPYVKNLVFMGGHADADNIIKAFDENESIIWKVSEGKRAEYAHGVQTLQLLDARLTYLSIFEVEKDIETGQTIYDTDKKSPKIIGVKPFGIKILSHLCKLAEQHIAQGHPKPIFISWKEFTTTLIQNTEIGKRMHACLEVGHFDNTRGLNYDGRKVFLKFGYPKARHDVIKQKAEILHHNDKEPLDETYEKMDDIQVGYQATGIQRYKDPRMEAQRQQEIRDKAEQTVYRSRPTRWENTTTIDFSAEPIPAWTERAIGFILTDFLQAETFEGIAIRASQREALTANNTIEDFQRIYMCSERHARRLWEQAGGKDAEARKQAELKKQIHEMQEKGMSIRAIAKDLGENKDKIARLSQK